MAASNRLLRFWARRSCCHNWPRPKDERNRSAWIDWCKPESVECRECRTALVRSPTGMVVEMITSTALASAVDVIISTTMPVGERTRAVLHSLHSTDSGLHQSIHADLFLSSFGRGQLWQQERRAQNRRSLFDAAIGVFQHPLER